MWNKFLNLFNTMSEKEKAIKYLEESYDHVDLERRMKELDDRGIRWY